MTQVQTNSEIKKTKKDYGKHVITAVYPEQFDEIYKIASKFGLSISTLSRKWVLEEINKIKQRGNINNEPS